MSIPTERDAVVEIGYQAVRIDKLYGPMIFADLRVYADPESGDWVIQRDNSGPHGEGGPKWVEVARVPGQIDSDFDCGKRDGECGCGPCP